MQINRLFEIVYLLLDKKSITSKELAAYFEVSVRTVLRDVETLSMAGIPIYTAQGKCGGIRLMENFVLNKSVLTDTEQQNILSALQGMKAVEMPDADKMLSKLSAVFNKNASSWIDIDFSPWDAGESERDKFSILRDAILSKRLVKFDYFSYYGEKSMRTAEPLQIVFKEKAWYLSAFCKDKNDYRTFKLSRIKNLEAADDTFESREIRKISDTAVVVNHCEVILKIDEPMIFRANNEFAAECISHNADGSITVKALLPYEDWSIGWVLSYGEHAEVLQPQYMREKIKQILNIAVKKYE